MVCRPGTSASKMVLLSRLSASPTLLLSLLLAVLISSILKSVTMNFQLQIFLVAERPNLTSWGTEPPNDSPDDLHEIPVATSTMGQDPHPPDGIHCMLDFYDVRDPELFFLESKNGEEWVKRQIRLSGMTYLGSRFHLFPGGGVTAIFLLSQSHISIHTWPEHSFAAIDIYACGNSSSVDFLVDSMFSMLKPGNAKMSFVNRGSNSNHSVRVEHVPGSKLYDNVPNTHAIASPPVLMGTNRPELLVLPMTVDLCVNAGFPGDECFLWRNASLLYSERSAIQLIEVALRQTDEQCLVLDGIVQFCDTPDNDLYSKALTDPVMQPFLDAPLLSPSIDVCIVGGGDGWIANYLLASYSSLIRTIRIIDIDPQVASVTQAFFGANDSHSSFIDSRVEWIHSDAAIWFHDAPDAVADAVIVDGTDHTETPSEVLYTNDFYSDLLRVLRKGGWFSQQMNTADDEYETWQRQIKELWRRLGFVEVMEWRAHIGHYGSPTVMMSGAKSKL